MRYTNDGIGLRLFFTDHSKTDTNLLAKPRVSTGCLKIQLTSRRDALSCATQSTQGLYGNMQSYSTLFSTTLFQGTEKTIINFSLSQLAGRNHAL
jgi:hypothetical protein